MVLVADYRFERVEVIEKDPSEIFYVGEAPVNVSRFGSAILSDTRDDPITPKKGTLFSIQLSGASSALGSDVSFLKNYAQWFHYRPLGKMVLASGVRVGAAWVPEGELIATERFFAGGAFSVRGFEKQSIGPTDPVWGRPMGGEATLLINEEIRFPLPIREWVGGVVFYDGGNVYETVSDFNPLKLRHSAGIGLRFNTPLGLGRIDWGFNLFPEENERRSVLHISLGHAF